MEILITNNEIKTLNTLLTLLAKLESSDFFLNVDHKNETRTDQSFIKGIIYYRNYEILTDHKDG